MNENQELKFYTLKIMTTHKQEINKFINDKVKNPIIKTFLNENKLNEIYKLTKDNDIIGFIAGKYIDEEYDCRFKINYIYVIEEERNKGYGSKMIEFLKYKHQNLLYITNDNDNRDKYFKGKEPFKIEKNNNGSNTLFFRF